MEKRSTGGATLHGKDLRFLREEECTTCARVTWYEQPPCEDGHGVLCDEWACTICGTAVLIGLSPSGVEQVAHRARVPHRAA